MREPRCDECPLGTRPRVLGHSSHTEGTKVFTINDDRPIDLVVVGMAPAAEELQQKIPMVGPSGRFLRKTLSQLNIVDYHVANCLLCPIPGGADPDDITTALACCRERLEDEILEKNPKLLLALGAMPLTEFCGNGYGIRETEGRLLMSRLDIPLVPVAHPAYYLRRPDEAFDFIECTRAGVRYLDNNYHQVGEVTRTTVTKENLQEALADLGAHDDITLDAETSGFHALGLYPDRILEIGLGYDSKHVWVVPPDLIPEFKDLIETKRIYGWNLFFDCRFMKAIGITPNMYFDGMLAHYCLDERQYSHGLKRVARVYVGADDWESNIKQYLKNPATDSYAIIPTEVRREYLAKDVAYSQECCDLLKQEVAGHWVFWNILMPATKVFTETMFDGIRIDPYKMVSIHGRLREELDQSERELWEMAGRVINPASPKEVSEILYDQLGVPMDPSAGRTTNKKFLEQWRYEYPFIDKLITHREAQHDMNQYVEGFAKRIDRDFKVHPTIRMFGAVTGRISSEDPSIMNIKRDSVIKEIFIADEGQLLAEFDLTGAELRWYCIEADDQVLRDIIAYGYQGDLGVPLNDKQKKDPHYIIGAIAYGPDRAYELRAAAKMTVFGRIYLRGLGSIERQYGRETAKRLVDAMEELVPNHHAYTSRIKRELKERGYVESFFGRQRRYPLITSENRSEVQRQGVNMPIQSASSDLNLLNLIFLHENRHRWDIKPMFTVHDSIMVQIPDSSVIGPIKRALEENALKVVNGLIPFTYDVKYGRSWGEAVEWKEAEEKVAV